LELELNGKREREREEKKKKKKAFLTWYFEIELVQSTSIVTD
jgi:hypothetical protein